MTHAEALDGKFLPDLDEEQRKRFTPSEDSELIMYKHAQDYRYIGLYTSISQYIHVYTVIYVSCDRWKAIELKKTIDMLCRPGFDSKETDSQADLQERMQQAVQDGCIKCCISGMYIVIICIYSDIQVYVGIYVFILEVGCVCS